MKCICSALKRNSDRNGFTLVELIVVIAILAILSAVAYPVYTGYITKANEAADQTLLGAVNEAFVSALYDVGYNDGLPEEAAFDLDGTTVTIGNKGAISLEAEGGLLPAIGLTNLAEFNTAFSKYYQGNESTPFKIFKTLIYDGKTGGFGGQYDNVSFLANNWKIVTKKDGSGIITYTVTDADGNKYEYRMSEAAVQSYKESTFGQNMGMSGLMGEVNNVADVFALFLSDPSLSANAEQFEEQLKAVLGDGLTFDDPSDPNYYKEIGNALVLGVAMKSDSFDAKALGDKWANPVYGFNLGDLLSSSGDFTEMASQLALGYALTTGFANSGDETLYDFGTGPMTAADYYAQQVEAMKDTSGLMSAFSVGQMLQNMIKTQGFRDYYAKSGQADIDGYLAAMQTIRDNKDTLLNGNDIVKDPDGVADEDLGAILDALFGGGN